MQGVCELWCKKKNITVLPQHMRCCSSSSFTPKELTLHMACTHDDCVKPQSPLQHHQKWRCGCRPPRKCYCRYVFP